MVTKSLAPRALGLVIAVTALGGCFGSSRSCEKMEPYQSSKPAGELRVPGDLSRPDGGAAMRVPEIDPGIEVRGPCADVPPKVVVTTPEPEVPPPAVAAAPEAPVARETPRRASQLENRAPIVIPSITGIPDVDVTATLQAWLEAWRRGEVDTYLSFYDDSFAPAVEGETRAEWEEKRALLLSDTGYADIRYDMLTITESDDGARARFIQEFHTADGQINAVVKILELKPRQFRWLIVREEVEMVL